MLCQPVLIYLCNISARAVTDMQIEKILMSSVYVCVVCVCVCMCVCVCVCVCVRERERESMCI